MALVDLNKFEILWLCEGAIGKSHLRWGIYEKMVNALLWKVRSYNPHCKHCNENKRHGD